MLVMAYSDRFTEIDILVTNLTPFVNSINDSSIKAKYAGFLSVGAVTVYELAIKDIFIEFSHKKHSVFGGYVEKHLGKINGKIT
jgi:hypothetical protein